MFHQTGHGESQARFASGSVGGKQILGRCARFEREAKALLDELR